MRPSFRFPSRLWPILTAAVLGGCVSIFNDPINQLTPLVETTQIVLPETPTGDDETIVGLGFSGGGTRAAAFAYGMLRELEATPVPGEPGRSLLDHVRFISGVSGGSVTAAYYGVKGKGGYHDLRDRFLIRDGEATMRTNVGPINLLRAFKGGVNDQNTFGAWLDKNVFEGATFKDMWRPDRPVVWINASDLYNRTPFIFNRMTFEALCSNLGDLPIADAVAASAAVPVIFTPIILEVYGDTCAYKTPGWLARARSDPSAPSSLKDHARALEAYRDRGRLRYVKLVDGGLTDNFGVTGITLARAQSQTLYGPFTAKQAVKVKRVIYLVADASQTPDNKWAGTVKGPNLPELVMAVTDTAINSSVREGYDAFRAAMREWLDDLIEYRCSLSDAEVAKLRGSLDGWNCRDVKFFVSDINAFDVDDATRIEFDKIKTRLKLPVEQVDYAIATGRKALRSDPIFLGALRSLKGINIDGAGAMTPTTTLHPTDPGNRPAPDPSAPSAALPADAADQSASIAAD